MARPSKTSKRALDAAGRKVRALELRLLGWKQPDIAAELGVSQQAVSRMLLAARAERDTAIAARAEELRADEIDRLDMLTKKVSALMEARVGKRGRPVDPDPWLIIKAALAIKSFGEARAKLLALNLERPSDDADAAMRAAGDALVATFGDALDKAYGHTLPRGPGEGDADAEAAERKAGNRRAGGMGDGPGGG